MIDWWWVFSNALWVSGCAVALAALSYAHYAANVRTIKLRVALRRPGLKTALSLAAVLFCAGLAATASTWWEAVIWLGLGTYALFQLVRVKRYNL